MSKVNADSAARLRRAVGWAADGDSLEVDIELGEIDPGELDGVVEVLSTLLEHSRRLRRARDARVEAAARAEAASTR